LALRSFLEGALFAEAFGSGTPEVLALHGWGRRGSDFATALSGLDAIAPDLPGFGASPAPDAVIGADSYADIVAEILHSFDRPPVLVGHSFGGRVAVCLATGRRPPVAYRAVRWLNRVGVVSDERLEREKRSRGSADYRAATGVMRDILVKVVNESYEGQLSRIESPVHLLWGSEDREVPVSVAESASALLSEVTLQVLPGVGHMVPIQAPEALRRAIDGART
jgi:pimeloyl-ACP methyl ester carboxylesterase